VWRGVKDCPKRAAIEVWLTTSAGQFLSGHVSDALVEAMEAKKAKDRRDARKKG
jgi:hypothetical protein